MRKTILGLLLFGISIFFWGAKAQSTPIFINEIHYDNTGSDVNETIEIAGTAGFDLSNWSLVLYNGNGGAVYQTIPLSGTLSTTEDFGFLSVPVSGLQNGAPDGIALINAEGIVVQLLSYEGSFTATNGPAQGMTSQDIGVSENSTTAVGQSLQLTGSGTVYEDFTWRANNDATFGITNEGQSFTTTLTLPNVWINEIHYDNTGRDTAEAIEIAGPLNVNLSGWSLVLYNGNGEAPYRTQALSGIICNGSNGIGFIKFPISGIQNGAPDGLALIDATGNVLQFLSYEGTLTASSGPAMGMTSEDIGVAENSSTPIGQSLQLSGTGESYNDFVWQTALPQTYGAINTNQSIGTPPPPPVAITKIHDIQGTALESPIQNQTVTIEGIVIGNFQEGVQGFYVQEEDADADTNPLTSEGIFVFTPNGATVQEGDRVQVSGNVTEFFSLTELNNVTTITIIDRNNPLPTSSVITLPVANEHSLEAFEGMRVRCTQELTVTNTFLLGRAGELTLSANDRIYQPTQVVRPGQEAANVSNQNALRTIIIDDASTMQNPETIIFPAPEMTFDNAIRGGYTTSNVTGVLTQAWSGFNLGQTSTNAYRIYVSEIPSFITTTNPRTNTPDAVGGTLKVASFNVLNYFNGDGLGGGFPTPRGADTLEEFERQRNKIINAIFEMNADIIGLMEIENDGFDSRSAIQDLINGLNALGGTYAFVSPETPQIGTDAIAVGFIYNTTTVSLKGNAAILDSSIDSLFDDSKNRPALAQSFTEDATGQTLTVCVNHLKSKGSNCDAQGDPDTGDGQGNCNLTRTNAAIAIANWLATDPTNSESPYVMIIGDLNAYAKEDPIVALENAGYVNTLAEAQGLTGYSYSFSGQWGTLDYALANAALHEFVTGTTAWHINADEPISLDYNTEFKSSAQITSFYDPSPFRASDHDPIIVGVALPQVPVGAYVTPLLPIDGARKPNPNVTPEILKDLDIVIAPNPASKMITLRNTGTNPVYAYALTNLQGKLAKQGRIYNGIQKVAQIDISTLRSGTYILSMTRQDGSIAYRIIVRK